MIGCHIFGKKRMSELVLTLQKRMMKVVVGILAVLSVVVGQTCFEGPGGASMTETKAGGHNIQVVVFARFFYFN